MTNVDHLAWLWTKNEEAIEQYFRRSAFGEVTSVFAEHDENKCITNVTVEVDRALYRFDVWLEGTCLGVRARWSWCGSRSRYEELGTIVKSLSDYGQFAEAATLVRAWIHVIGAAAFAAVISQQSRTRTKGAEFVAIAARELGGRMEEHNPANITLRHP